MIDRYYCQLQIGWKYRRTCKFGTLYICYF